MDFEATNPSLLLTTDPNLECSRTEMQNIPLLQSIELRDQMNNSIDIIPFKNLSNSVHEDSSNKNMYKNN